MPRYAADPITDKSLRHSVREGVAYSVMSGGAETYFSAFALFLKATTTQIGWLASLPPLLGSFAQLLSAWVGHLTGRRRPIILFGASLQAAVWLPMLVLPFLFPQHAVILFIACVMLYYAFTNLAAPQWNSLMGDLVPEKRRGRYFARRTGLASVTAFISLIVGGLILYGFDEIGWTASGFVVVFIIAALARIVSVYHLSRMVDPPGHVAALQVPTDMHWWQRLFGSPFARFSLFFALLQTAVSIAAPFFSVYMLRDLKYSYLLFMINTAASVLMQVLTLNAWGRVGDHFGNRKILVMCGSLIPVFPMLWTLSPNYFYLVCLQAMGGLVWAGFSLSAGNFFFDLVPAGKRATYLALHNVLASIGIFIGASLGGYLGAVLPKEFDLFGHHVTWGSALFGVFLLSTACRLVIVLLFLPRVKEVREVRPVSVGGLLFRVARYNALAGLFFELIGRRRPRPAAEPESFRDQL